MTRDNHVHCHVLARDKSDFRRQSQTQLGLGRSQLNTNIPGFGTILTGGSFPRTERMGIVYTTARLLPKQRTMICKKEATDITDSKAQSAQD